MPSFCDIEDCFSVLIFYSAAPILKFETNLYKISLNWILMNILDKIKSLQLNYSWDIWHVWQITCIQKSDIYLFCLLVQYYIYYFFYSLDLQSQRLMLQWEAALLVFCSGEYFTVTNGQDANIYDLWKYLLQESATFPNPLQHQLEKN